MVTIGVAGDPPQQRNIRILLVSTSDLGGGAERSAWNLFKSLSARGQTAWMAVGKNRTSDPHVALIPNEACRPHWAKGWYRAAGGLRMFASSVRGMDRLRRACYWVGNPRRSRHVGRGYEDYDFPGTWKLFDLFGVPDIVHCFNLHGGYFDLRALPWLAQRAAVILDLRDAWLLSGHCAHSVDCERWKLGCGACPDLSLYPAIRRDGTAHNWQTKRDIYARSRFYVATPSNWLMNKVAQSMLLPSVIESRVIPTGVQLNQFHSGDRSEARRAMNLPQNGKILMFAANAVRRNVWKDLNALRAAIGRIAKRVAHDDILFLAVGDTAPSERIGNVDLLYVPFQNDPEAVAQCYRAADIYVHAARADTFPRAVVEALACGIPVVATAVGGIPEQIKPLRDGSEENSTGDQRVSEEEATGILVQPNNPEELAAGIELLLNNASLRQKLGRNAESDARRRFDLKLQTDRYMEWYHEIVGRRTDLMLSASATAEPFHG